MLFDSNADIKLVGKGVDMEDVENWCRSRYRRDIVVGFRLVKFKVVCFVQDLDVADEQCINAVVQPVSEDILKHTLSYFSIHHHHHQQHFKSFVFMLCTIRTVPPIECFYSYERCNSIGVLAGCPS